MKLFLVSWLLLFMELACIRWFAVHVVFLTYFTNLVLLACFLGMSVGCLTAGRQRNYLNATPALLGIGVLVALGIERLRGALQPVLDVGNQASPQVVFFGTEYTNYDPANFLIPIEAVAGFFFVVIALAFVGIGQQLGRALGEIPNRVQAYTVNILGSLAGIVLFTGISWLELSPFWWFLLVGLGIGWLLYPRPATRPLIVQWIPRALLLAVVAIVTPMAGKTSAGSSGLPKLDLGILGGKEDPAATRHYWSPYYRIDYDPPPVRTISANLLPIQQMHSIEEKTWGSTHFYALPYLLNRDSGSLPFEDVLVIGSGSGNDISRALQWGAKSIDAVEIDPVVLRLGKQDHPDHPYDDARVHDFLGDGRNFLRSTDKKYDLILYALVDSVVLHSSYSSIRLESYLFTEQAFRDVRRCLKPGGLFVTYNYFRQGWIVARLDKGLKEAFDAEPVVLTLPFMPRVDPEKDTFNDFTILVDGVPGADGKPGRLDQLRQAFQQHKEYWLAAQESPGTKSPDGFANPPEADRKKWRPLAEQDPDKNPPWRYYAPAEVVQPAEPLRVARDDWPFLYLRNPMIPLRPSLTGMAMMAVLTALVLFFFLRGGEAANPDAGPARRLAFDGRMFFLGAGFMLIETKAVVHMALLFGSTWMVNSVVIFAVLVMILAANLFVLAVRPQRLDFWYAGLVTALMLNALVPLDYFLGMDRTVQILLSCLLVFGPIGFAGVIFAVSFSRTAQPDLAFAANIAGAMLGGLAEYTSMLVGFQYLVLVALGLYALSVIRWRTSQPDSLSVASNTPDSSPAA